MQKPRAKRPSPALIISMIALFVAIGGSAYAAKKIGTKEIKKNAITAAKIKKNAVTTAKIKNNAVNGAKVNESTLGTVPRAADAVNATSAANATNFSRYHTSGLKKASPGQTVTLLKVGPFTITGKCLDLGAEKAAHSYITTSQAGSNLYGYASSYYEGDFNPGLEAELSDEAQGSNTYVEWSATFGQYTEFRAASADGATILEGESVNAVFYAGSPCAFWVSATNVA
jgi:hypothetical protein